MTDSPQTTGSTADLNWKIIGTIHYLNSIHHHVCWSSVSHDVYYHRGNWRHAGTAIDEGGAQPLAQKVFDERNPTVERGGYRFPTLVGSTCVHGAYENEYGFCIGCVEDPHIIIAPCKVCGRPWAHHEDQTMDTCIPCSSAGGPRKKIGDELPEDWPSPKSVKQQPRGRMNVDDWGWTIDEAREYSMDAQMLTQGAMMSVFQMGAHKDAQKRAIVVKHLRRAISLAAKAIELQDPPIPQPYATLACAHAILGFCSEGSHSSDEVQTCCRGALSVSEDALERYRSTEGWWAEGRYNLHVCTAVAALLVHDLKTARRHLDEAKPYAGEATTMGETAALLESSLGDLDRKEEALGIEPSRKKSSLGTILLLLAVGATVVWLLVLAAR